MNSTRHMLLGAFIALALALLGYYTLFLGETDLFGEKYEITVQFPDAHGLRPGDSVLVAGVRWGKVLTIDYMPEAREDSRIQVVAKLARPLTIREGHEISIRDATMLGGRLVVIEPGPSGGAQVPADAQLYGTVAGNPLDKLGDLVNENSASLTETLSNLNAFTSDIRTSQGLLGRVINDQEMADSFAATVANLEQVSEQMANSQGTIGKLLSDDSLYTKLSDIGTNLNKLIAEAREVVGEVREGDGLVARLLNDKEFSDNFAGAVADIRDLVAKVKAGEGSFGKFVNEDGLYDNAEKFSADLAVITGRLVEGEGTLGKLMTEDVLYVRIDEITANLAVFSAMLANEDGTVARLLNDDKLYDDLEKVIGVALKSLEEYREAAPITTFTSVLFGAF